MMTSEPEKASVRPAQNAIAGRRLKASHVIRPTKMGVWLPRRVALAADVRMIEVL